MTPPQQFMFFFNAFILFSLLYFVQNGHLQDQNGCMYGSANLMAKQNAKIKFKIKL